MQWRTLWCSLLILLCVIMALFLLTGQADAHALLRCSAHQTPQHQLRCGNTNVHRGTTSLTFLHNHPRVGTAKSRKALADSAAYLIHYGNQHVEQALARMLPPHNAGWECIHSREGSWSDTGDPYWGGLQMHPGWGGVHHASDLSPTQQKWLAEREYRRTGYSHAWLAGQWPNTYPPCARFF